MQAFDFVAALTMELLQRREIQDGFCELRGVGNFNKNLLTPMYSIKPIHYFSTCLVVAYVGN